MTGTLEPGLRDGDYPAAVISTVEALGSAAVDAPPTANPITPAPEPTATEGSGGGSTDGGGGIDFGAILAVAVIVGGGVLVWLGLRQRSRPAGAPGAPGTPEQAPPDPEALARQANALLIATDERIRDAAQETDFAEAQYGADAVVSFRAAVAEAREELSRAFVVRQRLDDDTPEDEPTTVAMLQAIIAGTTRAQERLDAETDRIRELHDLERDAPNRIVELPGQIEAVEDRLDATEATMRGLRQYAEPVWSPVAGNLEEARKGLAGARTAVTTGSQAIAEDDRSAVAVATRTAMEGVTGATALLDEIDQLAASVAEALRRIPEELTEAGRDLADATAAVAGRAVDPAVDARRRAAESALDAARSAALAQPADPLATLRLVTEAHRLADESPPGGSRRGRGRRPGRGRGELDDPDRGRGGRSGRDVHRLATARRRRGRPDASGRGAAPPRPRRPACLPLDATRPRSTRADARRPSPRRPTAWRRTTSRTGTRAARAGASDGAPEAATRRPSCWGASWAASSAA